MQALEGFRAQGHWNRFSGGRVLPCDFRQRIFLGAHTHHVGTVPRGFNEIILLVGAYDMVL